MTSVCTLAIYAFHAIAQYGLIAYALFYINYKRSFFSYFVFAIMHIMLKTTGLTGKHSLVVQNLYNHLKEAKQFKKSIIFQQPVRHKQQKCYFSRSR